MGQRVIDKITRLAPNFERSIIRHTTFTPKHMGVMFGAPGGDYCHGLLSSDQIGQNRPGPKGYIGQPIPVHGLYLGSAGCHGGPGITFTRATTRAVRRWKTASLSCAERTAIRTFDTDRAAGRTFAEESAALIQQLVQASEELVGPGR